MRFFILSIFISFSISGETKLDSLLADIKNNPSDTAKAISCSLAGFEYILANNAEDAILITAKGFELAKRKDFLKGMAKCLVTQGLAFSIKNDSKKTKELLHEGEKIWIRLLKSKNKKDQYFASVGLGSVYNNLAIEVSNNGDINEALRYHDKALQFRKVAGDKLAIANSCNNISVIHADLGNISLAIEFSFEALKIYEDLKDSVRMGKVFGNLGLHHEDLGDYTNAIEYEKKALFIGRRFDNHQLTGNSLNNLGSVYMKTGKYNEAAAYFNEALKIYTAIENKLEQSNIRSNLGSLFLRIGQKKEALEYFKQSLALKREIGDRAGESIDLGNIGQYFLEAKDYSKAIAYADSALAIAAPLGNIHDIKDFHATLFSAYSKKHEYEKALFHYEQHILLRDSIMKEDNKKAGIKKQLQYDYEKKSAADSVKNAEAQKVKDAQLTAQTASLEQEKMQFWFLVCGLTFVIGGLVFVVNRFRVTQKQKKVIEKQKLIVDEAFEKLHEKNKEVMDSIHYARRIQTALITSEKYFQKNISRLNKNQK